MPGYPIDTGVAVLDRDSGKEFGFCQPHIEVWQETLPEMFDTRLVVMGPLFGTDYLCPVCESEK